MSVASGTLGGARSDLDPEGVEQNAQVARLQRAETSRSVPRVTLVSLAHPRLYRFVAFGDKKGKRGKS